MHLRWLIVPALGLLCGCGGDDAATGAGMGPRVSLVRVGAVTREPVQPTTAAVGTIIARRTSVVASGAEGKVDQFLVSEGDVVAEGQELSVLNMVTTDLEIQEAEALLRERQQYFEELQQGSRPEEIEEALARMQAAQVTMQIASERLTRWERLAQGSAASQDTLDDAREKAQAAEKLYTAAKAAYDLVKAGPRAEAREQAKARLDAQQHQVEFLKAERDKRTTHAPFRGVVVSEHTEAGQWLSKGASVVTLADLLGEMYVIANVDQRELHNVQLGADVTVTVDGIEPREWPGKVVALIPRSQWESGARTFPVKVAVQNQVTLVEGRERALLNEGMLARVVFFGAAREATLVPKSSLVRAETGARLYAVIPGDKPDTGKARPVMVQEGGAYGDRVEILGEELQPGMLVVTEGAERLTPFADVSIQRDAPPAGPAGPGAPQRMAENTAAASKGAPPPREPGRGE
jgi:RND family efflux transporter MFP subunit